MIQLKGIASTFQLSLLDFGFRFSFTLTNHGLFGQLSVQLFTANFNIKALFVLTLIDYVPSPSSGRVLASSRAHEKGADNIAVHGSKGRPSVTS